MLSIAICGDKEDILLIHSTTEEYLKELAGTCDICCFSSGSEFLKTEKDFDLLFMVIDNLWDIHMGKIISKRYREMKIIGITGQLQYLRQAINEIHTFACLEKPVNKHLIVKQLSEVLARIDNEKASSPIVRFKIIEIDQEYRIESKIMDFKVEDIYYFEYTNRKICLRVSKKSYFFNDTMSNLRMRMQPYNFYYCHQSYLVNMRYVSNIKGYRICLCNDDIIPLAQKRSVDFRKKFTNLTI